MEVETTLAQDNVVKENGCLNIKEINKKFDSQIEGNKASGFL